MYNKVCNKNLFFKIAILSIISLTSIIIAALLPQSHSYNFLKEYLFLFIALLILPCLLLIHLIQVEKKTPIINADKTIINGIRDIIFSLFIVFNFFIWITILFAFELIDLNKSTSLFYGFLGILGLYSSKYIKLLPINKLIGIRNKYTLNNPEIWQKTHIFCAKFTAFFAGIFILQATLIANNAACMEYPIFHFFIPLSLTLYTIILHSYARYIYKKISK